MNFGSVYITGVVREQQYGYLLDGYRHRFTKLIPLIQNTPDWYTIGDSRPLGSRETFLIASMFLSA